MFLRALGSLTRRLSPRGIPRARAQPQIWAQESSPGIISRAAALRATAARPARALHTGRGLADVSGSLLSVIMAAGIGLGGLLYFKNDTDSGGGESTPVETDKQYDVQDETALKESFEQWMKEYGKTYRTEREKARRYEIFKDHVRNGRGSQLKGLADWTEHEIKSRYRGSYIDPAKLRAGLEARYAEVGPDYHLGDFPDEASKRPPS